jgi:hypothetical protein
MSMRDIVHGARRRTRRRIGLAALAALTSGSCVQEPTVPRLGEDPVTITLSLTSLTLRLGQPDTLRATIQNTLTQTVGFSFANVCRVYFTVRNQAGDVVTPRDGRAQCVAQRSTLTLPAGGRQVFTAVWRGGFDFVPLDTPGVTVPPGSYFVSAQFISEGYSVTAPAFKVDVTP